MPTGTVKWFNNAKGYGFLCTDEKAGEDIFVHYSSVKMDGYKTLKAGQKVDFELEVGPKGLHASNIAPSSEFSETIAVAPSEIAEGSAEATEQAAS